MFGELGPELITWDSGKIVIPGPSSRLAAVLPQYFRHGKFTSFQRQLNNFGFHKKISESSSKMRIYTREDMLGFPAEALLDLRRKPGAACASWEPGQQTGAERLKHVREALSVSLSSLAGAHTQEVSSELKCIES